MTAGPQNCKDFELTPGIHATNKILEFVSWFLSLHLIPGVTLKWRGTWFRCCQVILVSFWLWYSSCNCNCIACASVGPSYCHSGAKFRTNCRGSLQYRWRFSSVQFQRCAQQSSSSVKTLIRYVELLQPLFTNLCLLNKPTHKAK
jgi:hypothetical protein